MVRGALRIYRMLSTGDVSVARVRGWREHALELRWSRGRYWGLPLQHPGGLAGSEDRAVEIGNPATVLFVTREHPLRLAAWADLPRAR